MGKTTAVDLFSKEFDHYIYVNLERPGESDYFRRNLQVRDVFQAILLSKKISVANGRCLLFIDEIQNCPEAVSYLRYFFEEMKELYVIAAGSMLEAMVNRGQLNFPVGRVEFMYMFPLSFHEFCGALNEEQTLSALSMVPFPEYAYAELLKKFHEYVLVGGMPEPVAAYSEKREITLIAGIYESLMTALLDDIPKYARNHTLGRVMRHCLESAPMEAGKRIAFARFGKSEYRSREAGESLKTLQHAMLLYLLYPSMSNELPIIPDTRKSPRLQFLDTGLLNALAGLQHHFFKMENLHSLYRGMLAEHIVAQELLCSSFETLDKPCFGVRENVQSNAEVDFVLQHKGMIIPVEVKSGAAGTLRSLYQFIDACSHDMAVRLYAGPLSVTECITFNDKKFRLLNIPYFLASQIHDYLTWAFG